MKRWQRLAITAFGGFLLLGSVGLLGFFSRAQAHELVTHPLAERAAIDETPGDYGHQYEEVTVTTADGLRLVGWYLPSQNGAAIIAQHGYKSDRRSLLEEADVLARHGYGVLVSTVRAHDESDGQVISFGYHEMQDLQAWYEFLLTRPEVDPERIGMLGNSMGGSLVIQYAAENPAVKAVVAHSAFSSLDDTVSTSVEAFTGLPSFPFAPAIVFWAEQELGIDSSEVNAKLWIGAISPRPVLILQGGQDEAISVESGQLLYDAADEPKELWFEPALGHTEFDTELPELFEARVTGFYDRHLLGE